MRYIEVSCETSETGIELLTAALDAAGISDTEVSDPRDVEEIMDKKESYEWDYIEESVVHKMEEAPRVSSYFPEGDEGRQQADKMKEVLQRVAEDVKSGMYGPDVDLGSMKITEQIRDDADWKDKWKAYFKPFHVSEHLVVCPSWEKYDPQEGEKIITIDPGMAFGTGTHETTSMCLALLEKYLKKGTKVLDAGTGSGILSIAAALLGAGEVLGVDVDRDAVRVAQENIAINHCENIARAEFGDLTKGVDYEADLIVGNLMAELICMLAEGIAAHLHKDGVFIASGILTEKEDMVEKAVTEAGLDLIEKQEKGEWSAMVFQK
ncbi:MAG: 50S ribosomal protein L11 methyltransferase [Eubacterium sp.]|jgi:ribosomal protein L11 methyltransferase|nr:50S ribosomal protein L11 methyltransferase [Eubacterium sp.]MCH4047321.1 50S ribosomal protein L11 methyltransferase [Eubacterium sp.]MCH4080417.1 50S ribosomal protein L11 methyltransferase [Eubacterium sp.]MCH4110665.1 50S ribosomal protein L11 methyltransferase [Eubacterium sp.]MCI1307215.1 50S ribosomal protein L11 methyltransferase [Eubacterium sp.]